VSWEQGGKDNLSSSEPWHGECHNGWQDASTVTKEVIAQNAGSSGLALKSANG